MCSETILFLFLSLVLLSRGGPLRGSARGSRAGAAPRRLPPGSCSSVPEAVDQLIKEPSQRTCALPFGVLRNVIIVLDGSEREEAFKFKSYSEESDHLSMRAGTNPSARLKKPRTRA
eukprot:scaffold26724_cov120-Isochrysis_galbana.AAC.6